MTALSQLTFDPHAVEPHSQRRYDTNPSRPAEHMRELDAVDPKIVAKINMSEVLKIAQTVEAAWARSLAESYAEGFEKREVGKDEPGAPSARSSAPRDERARETVRKLHEFTILRPVTDRARRKRTWASVFQVPKNEDLDRAIINCKLINYGFAKAPPLSLAEVGILLGLMSYFPDAVLATADIRHFFWQLRVPEADRHRFSIWLEEGRILECVALPMGWSWSPWVAQGVAGLVVVAAAARMEGVFAEAGPGVSDKSPPPYWFIKDEKTKAVKAIVVIWYDNFLVIAAAAANDEEGKDWNRTVRQSLDKAMKLFKIVWKRDKVTDQAWDVRSNEAEYIGIHVFRREGVFAWKHIDKNVAAWATASVQPVMPLVTVAQMLGVMAWDAHIRLGRRLAGEIRQLMSRVGSLYHVLNDAGEKKRIRDATEVHLNSAEEHQFTAAWDAVTRNEAVYAPERHLETLRVLASDATPTCAAGVFMDLQDEAGRTRHKVFDVTALSNRGAHINVVETMAAINTVRQAMTWAPEERNALYAIAVDNTTAVSWFNGKTALDEEAQKQLELLDRELEQRNSKAWAWWEPTKTQPADEPSKDKAVCENKVRVCRERLIASATTGLTQLKLSSYRTTAEEPSA